MIPKIIHLCWLSGDPYPPKIAKCLASWKKHLPDYEVMLWDTNRFDLESSIWVKQAFEKKKYAFEYAGFRIVIPTCPDDIIREGEKLRHCVGSYSDRHFSGKLTILFIRKITNPDKPYVTMEVRGKRIVQVHGYRNDINKPLPKSVKLFVEEFKKYIEQPVKYKKELEKEKARKTA